VENKELFNKIFNKIKEYKKIIIIRHKSPDYDAYGSQIGLYLTLKDNFKDKEIYMVGDENQFNPSNLKMDIISDDIYKDSLVIVVDTAHENMLLDLKYKLASFVIVMDHHKVDYTIADLAIVRSNYSSASELVSEFVFEMGLNVPKLASDMFFIGISGDSNRFLYKGTTDNTFNIASKLYRCGADIINDYKLMMKEERPNEKLIKGYVLSNFKIIENVAYIIVPRSIIELYDTDENYVARGCINLLSGMIGVDAFIGFTEFKSGIINVELRSKSKSIVNVAVRHKGGGHELACGMLLKSFDEVTNLVYEVIEELKK